MCGISGWIFKNGGAAPNIAKKMANAIKHRGPDDEGYFFINENGKEWHAKSSDTNAYHSVKYDDIGSLRFDARLCLLHRRLSIVELSHAGHQPMSARNVTISFNGEIYNFVELREELSSFWTFSTNTDTEVILAAYSVWGKNAFARFDGMWAVAIYDKNNNKILLSRDRYGEKPLYYYIDDNKVIFASEIKSIISSGLIEPKQNVAFCLDYLLLSLSSNKSNETFFENIRQVMPGQILSIDFSTLNIHVDEYWKIKENGTSTEINANEIGDKTRQFLDDSVHKRLRIDVPFATTLSGGLDSSVLTTIAAGFCEPGELQSYCLGGSDIDHDTYYAKKVQESIGVKLKFVDTPPVLTSEVLHKLIWHADEPIRDLGGNNGGGNLIYREIQNDGYKVVLEGNGADELLGGYPGIFLPFKFFSKITLNNFAETKNWADAEGYTRTRLLLLLLQALVRKLNLRLPFHEIKNNLSVNRRLGKKFINNYQQFLGVYNQTLARSSVSDFKDCKIDFIKNNAFPLYLKYVDRISMAHSIETRLPFLSNDFSTFALNIPAEHQIKNGFSKYNLREAYADLLPDEVIWRRKKQGFTASADTWLNNLKPQAFTAISNSEFLSNYFDISEIRKYFASVSFQNSQLEELHFFWRLYSFAVWEEIFFKKTNVLGV